MRSDDDLIGAFKAGNGSAMEALFGRYRKPVYAWLLRTAPDRAEAEDLYQEVWLKVIRGVGGYSAGGFKAWLWRIVRNAAADRARKHVATPILDEPLSDEADATYRPPHVSFTTDLNISYFAVVSGPCPLFEYTIGCAAPFHGPKKSQVSIPENPAAK